MAEKIFPASKPATTTNNPPFPATKGQQYNHSRPVYRPQPRRNRRSCCCSLCICITFTFIIFIVIAAAVGGVAYVVYRPHCPTFSVSTLHVSQFNISSSNKLSTRFNFTVTARNPNKKIVLYYDPVSVSFNSKDVDVGDGLIPGFMMGKKNTTALRTVVSVILLLRFCLVFFYDVTGYWTSRLSDLLVELIKLVKLEVSIFMLCNRSSRVPWVFVNWIFIPNT